LRIRCVWLLVLLILASSGIAHPQGKKSAQPIKALPDIIDEVKFSVVEIVYACGGIPTSKGTGFFVNQDRVVVTALHVVNINCPADIAQLPNIIIVSLPLPAVECHNLNVEVGNMAGFESTVIATDETHDLAILKPKSADSFPPRILDFCGQTVPIRISAAKLDGKRLRDGQSVFISGFPLDSRVVITTQGLIASGSPMSYHNTFPPKLDDFYFLDIHANPGNSGGPVFSSATGRVVGIVVASPLTEVRYEDGQGEAVKLPVIGPDGRLVMGPNGSPLFRYLGYNAGLAKVISSKHILDLLTKSGITIRQK
jgi:S1-C subfamily serine protease